MNALRGALFFACVALSACETVPGDGTSTSSSGGSSSGTSSSSGRSPIDSAKLCNRLVNECGQQTTIAECQRQFAAILVTPACATGLTVASCRDLTLTTSSVATACFPPCSGTISSCNGDGTITTCTTNGTTEVLDCAAACQADGDRAYSGTCGTTYGQEVADTPQCWCK